MILDPANASYFLYPDNDGNIEFKHGDPVLLSCSNTGGITFRNLDEPVSKVFNCVCNETFRADNTLYNFKDLGCTATPRHHVREAGEAGSYKRYQIGFQTTVENDFLNLVDVYYDLAYNRTAYVVSKISKYIRGGQRITKKNVSFGTTYQTYPDIDSFYNFESQVSSFALQFDIPEGKTVPYLSPNESYELKLTRSQLTPKLFMIYTAGVKATFEHLNVAPQWQLIGSHNWARIEQHVMDMASDLNRDLVVVTGTFDQLLLRDSYDNVNEMYLNAVVENEELQLRLPIPKFTFKVVMDTDRTPVAGVVYVTVNDPFMRVEEEDRYQICRTPFTNRDNMKTPERWMPEDPKQGFSYVCEVDDFLSTTRIVLPYIKVGDVQEFLFLPSDSNNRGSYGRSSAVATRFWEYSFLGRFYDFFNFISYVIVYYSKREINVFTLFYD